MGHKLSLNRGRYAVSSALGSNLHQYDTYGLDDVPISEQVIV